MRDYEMQRQLIQDGARSTTRDVATDGRDQLRIADTRMDKETLILEIVMDPDFKFYVKVSNSLEHASFYQFSGLSIATPCSQLL
jgi:hypothetical protein